MTASIFSTMGSVCSTSYQTKEASVAIASSVVDPVVGQVVDDSVNGHGAHLHIRDIVVHRTRTPDGYATYTMRHGKKVASFQALHPAAKAIISELRACFVDTASITTTFYVINDNGFNVGHFRLFQDIHPSDVTVQAILADLLREMAHACEKA